MCTRCKKKLWFLRRLKKLGASTDDLLDLYHKHVRSILEYAAPLWHSAINGEYRLRIERVQKAALSIILGDSYTSYRVGLKLTGLETLFERRRKLSLKFAQKSQKHPKFSQWFKLNTRQTITRQIPPKFCPVVTRTARFAKSPVSYFTSLNSEYEKRSKREWNQSCLLTVSNTTRKSIMALEILGFVHIIQKEDQSWVQVSDHNAIAEMIQVVLEFR